jgi:hypothetical protein
MNLPSLHARHGRQVPVLAALMLVAAGASLTSLFAQGTQAVVELWRAIDTDFIGVAMDLGPFDDVVEVGHTTILGDPIVTKKFDRDGRLLWERLHDPAERLRATWISADRFDNAFVSGFAFTGSNPTPSGLLTLKYDPQGTLLWANRIAGPFAQAVRVEADASGKCLRRGPPLAQQSVGVRVARLRGREVRTGRSRTVAAHLRQRGRRGRADEPRHFSGWPVRGGRDGQHRAVVKRAAAPARSCSRCPTDADEGPRRR